MYVSIKALMTKQQSYLIKLYRKRGGHVINQQISKWNYRKIPITVGCNAMLLSVNSILKSFNMETISLYLSVWQQQKRN